MNELPQIDPQFYLAALPMLILAVGAIVSMLQAVTTSLSGPRAVFGSLLFFLVASLASFTLTPAGGGSFLGGSYLADHLSVYSQVLILSVALLLVLISQATYIRNAFMRPEVASLLQMSLLGMGVMVGSDDLVTIFVGLELSSIAIYALVGYIEQNRFSQEGAIKYFILGAFASALLLMGFAFLYASTGAMKISGIMAVLAKGQAPSMWVTLGGAFTLFGLAFKLALAPFHSWSPDAYEAAPTPVTAMMATCVKVMVMVVMLRFFLGAPPVFASQWFPVISLLTILSMIAGNALALVQTSLKRMLAYSSIAHSGYMAIALCAATKQGEVVVLPGPSQAIFFYLIGYALSSLAAFGILMWLEDAERSNLQLDDLNGLASRHPWAAFGLATAMFSFAGMPPTVGFFGKFFLFKTAIQQGLYGVALAAALTSVVALYYYLRVIVRMYMAKPQAGRELLAPKPSYMVAVILTLALTGTLLLGTLLPGPALDSLRPLVDTVVAQK